MAKYKIPAHLNGKTVYVQPPSYERKDAGKFVLNDELSQKDRAYLVEKCNYPLEVEVEKQDNNKNKGED